MAPHLNVSAGPSVDALQTVYVNSDTDATVISTDKFRGRISVRIKHFTGDVPEGKERKEEAKYFEGGYGSGMTWSIQIQGRFLKEVSADNLVFGNQFERPIKDKLPYGTSIALHAAKYIDPNLEQDIYGDKPWAFSPLVATMYRISAHKLDAEPTASSAEEEFKSAGWPAFPTPETSEGASYVHDDVSSLIPAAGEPGAGDVDIDDFTIEGLKGGENGSEAEHAHRTRASWFGNRTNRQSVAFNPRHVVSADFCNAFIDFNTLRLELPHTGGMGFELQKYWDGQPVRYYCKDKTDDTVFFIVQFNIVEA